VAQLKLQDIRIVLADSRAFVRHSVKMALNDCGFRHVIDTADIHELTDVLYANPPPDLLICDADLRGGDVNQFIATLRHHEVGLDPFLPVIYMTWQATGDVVRGAIDCGTDFLLAAPVAPNQILARVWSIIQKRKLFVVTPHYVGPDRRTQARPGLDTPMFRPPNVARAKALGQWDEETGRAQLEVAIGSISARKIESIAVELGNIADDLPRVMASGERYMLAARLERITELALDLNARVQEPKFEHVVPMADAIRSHAYRLSAEDGGPNEKQIAILKHPALGLRAAIRPSRNTVSIGREIASVLGGPA